MIGGIKYQSQHSLNECAVGLGRQANLVSTAAKTLEKFLLSCKIHLDEDRPMLSGQHLASWPDVSLAWTILWPTCFCSSPWTTSTSLTFLCRASTAVVTTSVGTQVMVLFKLFIPPPGFVLIHMNGIQSSFYRFFNPVKSGLGGKWWLLGKPTRLAAEVEGSST